MRLLKLLLVFCMLGMANYVFAKKTDTTGFWWLGQNDIRLSRIAPLINTAETDQERKTAANFLFHSLDTILQIPGSFGFAFDSLKSTTVSIVNSPDKKFRFLTFNLVTTKGDFKQFGFLQMNDKEHSLYALADTLKNPKKDFLNLELETGEWLGALYYSIAPFKYQGKKMYLLLGFDGATIHSNKKILDVLWFDNGVPVFGKQLFRQGAFDRQPTSRVVFEFHNNSLMMLHYEEKKKIVVLDKLVPSFPEATNDFYYYIPSGDLDYFAFKKGWWIKDALENYNLGQGKLKKKPKSLPTPEADPQNQE
ncbi:MAG: hypothetical protein KG003_05850 [Bacteroidetes bacterium]|nr:hypothetical protein [Bacteroidota bacterium]